MPSMTPAERLRRTYNFQPVDHLVRKEFYISPVTIKRWVGEGLELPKDFEIEGNTSLTENHLTSLVGPIKGSTPHRTSKMQERFKEVFSGHEAPPLEMKRYWQIIEWLGKKKFNYDPPGVYRIKLDLGWVEIPFVPPYEEKVLRSEGEDYEIIQDTSGSQLRVFKGQRPFVDDFMPTYLRSIVSCWQEWEKNAKPRLDPATSGRYDGLKQSCAEAEQLRDANGTFIVQGMTGAYNYLRKLLGPEGVLYAFYDKPDVVKDMLDRWTELMDVSLERVQALVELDQISFAEDICYKSGSLISPKMFREFLTACYEYVVSRARARQNKYLYVHLDSDGYLIPVIDLYMEVGFDAISPWEVAAGNDVVKIGQKYPKLVMPCGGIDKRILAKDKQAINEHLEYIIPSMLKRGGYIPTCDHGVPPTVSWENYLYYRKRICELDH